MAWLDDHPPTSPQFRHSRREAISGVVVVHTAESVMDTVGPDTGAEVVAAFIARRNDPGSYHCLVDSDSRVLLVGDDAESFQVAADGHNRHAWGVSFACRTTDLAPTDSWTRAAIVRAGAEIAAFWGRRGFCVPCSARWVTNDQVTSLRSRPDLCPHGRQRGGLVAHGQLQPADRTDAWTKHPNRPDLEQLLVAAISPTSEEDDMPPYRQWSPEDRDALASDVAAKCLYAVSGGAKAQGQPWAQQWTNLGDVVNTIFATKGGTVDPKILAAQLADVLGPELAAEVADELAKRLTA